MQASNCNQEQFLERTDNLFALPLPRPLRVLLDYYESLILNDLGIKGHNQAQSKKNHKVLLSEELLAAVKGMSRQERMDNYLLISDYVFMFVHGRTEYPLHPKQDCQAEGYAKSNSGRAWKRKILTYDCINHILSITDPTSLKSKTYNLAYYLIRISKNEQYKGFVLEAADKRVKKNCRTVHVGFKEQEKFDELFFRVKQSINFRQWQLIKAMYESDATTKNSVNSMRKKSFQVSKMSLTMFSMLEEKEYARTSSSDSDKENNNKSIQKLYKSVGQQMQKPSKFPITQQESSSSSKKNSEQNSQLSPLKIYTTQKLDKAIESEKEQEKVIQKASEYKIIKISNKKLSIQFTFSSSINEAFRKYIELPSTQVENLQDLGEQGIKLTMKKFSKLLRNRYFIIKKSVEIKNDEIIVCFQNCQDIQEDAKCNKNVRGNLKSQTKFYQKYGNQGNLALIIVEMDNSGTLKDQQNQQIVIKYLKGIVSRFQTDVQKNIDAAQKHGLRQKISAFLPFVKNEDESSFEFQSDGTVKLTHNLFKKYQMIPIDKSSIVKNEKPEGMFSEQWTRQNDNQIKFTNQTVIDAQRGVFKYVISKMSKNIISGKSILNISLPVDIFSKQSNLQRLLHSFRLSPQLFEDASQFSTMKKLQLAGICTISSSLLYLSQEKCFNPILGQTAQLWIDGCPAYAQQISHHPPIAAIYYLGRGFKIYGTLESKVELHLNSGTGSNSGPITIEFDDGTKIVNFLPGGEVLGMAYGDRKFRISGKSYHLIEKNGEYLQISYENSSGSIFSSSKHKGLMGKFYKTESSQITNFIKNRKFLKKSKHSLQLHALCGSWHNILTNNESSHIFDFSKACPSIMKRDNNPLPSDSLWRQDITYRKLEDLEKAQEFKQKLEQRQRKDRKLRNGHQ